MNLYDKGLAVISSCTNLIQLEGAERYLILLYDKIPLASFYSLRALLKSKESALKSKKRFANLS